MACTARTFGSGVCAWHTSKWHMMYRKYSMSSCSGKSTSTTNHPATRCSRFSPSVHVGVWVGVHGCVRGCVCVGVCVCLGGGGGCACGCLLNFLFFKCTSYDKKAQEKNVCLCLCVWVGGGGVRVCWIFLSALHSTKRHRRRTWI